MTITIHRGIKQIGGCITEIKSEKGTKILIDLGHNLPEGDNLSVDIYDQPEKLDELLEGVDAVFYTHPHGDHLSFEAKVMEAGILKVYAAKQGKPLAIQHGPEGSLWCYKHEFEAIDLTLNFTETKQRNLKIKKLWQKGN